MADTIEVRLESGTFAILPADRTEQPEVYTAGDTFEVDEDVLDDHPQLVPTDDIDAESEDEGGDEEFDAEAFVDRTPMDDVVDDIESGEADDHLDAVEEAAEREGVKDAVESRRDELGEEGE